MNKTVIIIPSRLNAQRLPNKPLKLINNKPMITHVYDAALRSQTGQVYVASPDQEIIDLIIKQGGNAIKTSENHETGTDRIFEVFKKELKEQPSVIINLQGDMPNIKPSVIKKLIEYMKKSKCDIGTLASALESKNDQSDSNIVKVVTSVNIKKTGFAQANDFFRFSEKMHKYIYHHIGIYAFTSEALNKFIKLKRSRLEIKRNLEQLRALENNMKIDVGYVNNSPLSVDTKRDYLKVKRLMEK